VADPYTKRAELEGHMQKLVAQMAAIDKEIPTIDAVLNKGLRNQQSVVNELAAVSRELYRLAQEVRVETPTKRAPTDGSGYQKSVRKKDAGPSATDPSTPAPAAEGPSHTPTEAETPALPPRRKTVPLNPLMLASRRLGRIIDTATAKTAQVASAVLTPVAAAVGKAASTTSYVIGTALVMIFRPIGLGISLLVGAIARAYAASVERIKDIWPWRGPPPE
jgi:hypothetical protein